MVSRSGVGRRRERFEECIGLLDVRRVGGLIDHVQRPSMPCRRAFGDGERRHAVVATPEECRGNVDPAEVGVGDRLRLGGNECRIVCFT